jgi:pimeloyl-ACP methyl ester carboxylesterase
MIGNHDRARSNHLVQAEALTQRIPNAQLKILDGQSHGFFWQAPDETNQVILNWVKAHT